MISERFEWVYKSRVFQFNECACIDETRNRLAHERSHFVINACVAESWAECDLQSHNAFLQSHSEVAGCVGEGVPVARIGTGHDCQHAGCIFDRNCDWPEMCNRPERAEGICWD